MLAGRPAPSAEAESGVTGFDWGAAEAQAADVIGPAFADDTAGDVEDHVERSSVRLADVGGMEEVKHRLDMAFLTPIRNPQLHRLWTGPRRGLAEITRATGNRLSPGGR